MTAAPVPSRTEATLGSAAAAAAAAGAAEEAAGCLSPFSPELPAGGGGDSGQEQAGREQRQAGQGQREGDATPHGLAQEPPEPGHPGLRLIRQRVLLPAHPLAAGMPCEHRVVVGHAGTKAGVTERARHVLVDQLLPERDAVVRRPRRVLRRAQDADLEQGAPGVVPGDGEAVFVGACPHTTPVDVGVDLVGVTHVPPRRWLLRSTKPYHGGVRRRERGVRRRERAYGRRRARADGPGQNIP